MSRNPLKFDVWNEEPFTIGRIDQLSWGSDHEYVIQTRRDNFDIKIEYDLRRNTGNLYVSNGSRPRR